MPEIAFKQQEHHGKADAARNVKKEIPVPLRMNAIKSPDSPHVNDEAYYDAKQSQPAQGAHFAKHLAIEVVGFERPSGCRPPSSGTDAQEEIAFPKLNARFQSLYAFLTGYGGIGGTNFRMNNRLEAILHRRRQHRRPKTI